MENINKEVEFLIPKANVDFVKRKYLDIPYSNISKAQKLDIYLPDEGDGPFPVIIAIHGGAFMMGDKADIQVLPMLKALNRGYAVISINYRMSGETIFPKLVNDVKAAIRWVRANASKYYLNKGKIAAWGGSAGGYLASMAGASANVQKLEDLSLGNEKEPCNLQAVVTWFGPTDFILMDKHLAESGLYPQDHNEENSPESLILGEKITKIPEKVKEASPETYITIDAPPFFIQHGDIDNTVPMQQSVILKDKLLEFLPEDKVEFEIIKGAKHADLKFETEENVKKVINFLDKYLK